MMGTETAGVDSPYAALLDELDGSVQAIKEAAFALKRAAGGMQAVERNADRILASARMLEINVGDLTGRPRTMASWTGDDGAL